jgi:hypothetical protein
MNVKTFRDKIISLCIASIAGVVSGVIYIETKLAAHEENIKSLHERALEIEQRHDQMEIILMRMQAAANN